MNVIPNEQERWLIVTNDYRNEYEILKAKVSNNQFMKISIFSDNYKLFIFQFIRLIYLEL